MIIIELKGAVRGFYNLLTFSNKEAQVAMAQLWANHVQHTERLPH